MVTVSTKLKDTWSLEKSYGTPREHIKSRDITLPTNVHLVKAVVFPSLAFPVIMHGCESWTIKKADEDHMKTTMKGEELMLLNCGVGELESPLDCKEIKPVNPKGTQSWKIIGRTDAEAEAPIHWPPDAKSWLLTKDPDAGKDWRQEDKGITEDEMVGCHHWLDRHEFEQAPGVGDGQGSLVCCSPCSFKELDMTEQLNWTEHFCIFEICAI